MRTRVIIKTYVITNIYINDTTQSLDFEDDCRSVVETSVNTTNSSSNDDLTSSHFKQIYLRLIFIVYP